MVEHGTLAGHEVQAEAHGIGNRQNVGKKDGRVETVTVDRLQRHFRIGFFTLERTQKAIVDRFHGSHLETEEIQKS